MKAPLKVDLEESLRFIRDEICELLQDETLDTPVADSLQSLIDEIGDVLGDRDDFDEDEEDGCEDNPA